MKMKLSILLFSIFLGLITNAQLNKSAALSPDSLNKVLPGKLFTQFVQAVNPTSFKSSFAKEKTPLLKNIEKVDDPKTMAKKVVALSDYMKPDMFKTKFDVHEFSKRTDDAKTMIYSMHMLSDLEQALKPEALLGVWMLQKNNWVAEIATVK